MIKSRHSLLLTCALAAATSIFTSSLRAELVFQESFESPSVSGFDDNSVPDNGNWVGANDGFGATNRGLHNETVSWPETATFSTPHGEQAYFLNYTNSGLTTSQGAISAVLTAGVSYKVRFKVAIPATLSDKNYQVELLAFEPGDNDAARNSMQSKAGTILATASGNVTTSDMSTSGLLTFTPDGTNTHLGKEIGIRLAYAGNVLYDQVELIAGHDFEPTPENGNSSIASGNVNLSWTNRSPNSGSDVWVDVWFGTDPAALSKVVDAGLNSTSTTVSAPSADVYYWRVDSYLDGSTTGTPLAGDLFSFEITDSDGDGLPDAYELAHTDPASATGLNPGDDLENGGAGDGLTNAQEYYYGTDPNDADTDDDTLEDGPELSGVGLRPATSPVDADSDDDGFSDGVESNTGIWVSTSDSGTNPTDNDWDKDGIKDGAETNTAILVDRFNTGTDPYDSDTDDDGAGDYYEVNASFTNPFSAADKPSVPYPLPDPDGSTGATNKPVKVYIMAGQSNMVGIGYVNGINDPGSLEAITKVDNKFPNFIDAANNWTERQDVLYKGVVTATQNPGPLSANQGGGNNRVGVEMGFGHVMGYYHDEPVLLLKCSQGNRSLAWDFCPPSSTPWTLNGTTYAGYGDSPASWPEGGSPGTPVGWYAGKQYDECFRAEADMGPKLAWLSGNSYNNGWQIKHNGVVYSCTSTHTAATDTEPGVGASWAGVWQVYSIENAADVLANFATRYPQWAAQGYEIAGFVWWQGHKDQDGGTTYHNQYEENLANLIEDLRAEFNAPSAPFVVGTIGFGGEDKVKTTKFEDVYNAQLAVGDPAQHPEFAGTVKSVNTLPYWRELDESPGGQDFHYNNNAETYTLVGDAFARTMIELLESETPPVPSPMTFEIAPSAVDTTTIGMVASEATSANAPVEYYFENTTNSDNSGWITTRTWHNSGLTSGQTYSFRVKARDGNGLEGEWSATTDATAGADVTAPTPDPMSFATAPTALGESSVTMSATTASDINDVEYYFTCTGGGGNDSGWQDSPDYTDTGLTHSTEFTYTVQARDKSAGQNATTASSPASATTTTPDLIAPSVVTYSPDLDSSDIAIGTNLVLTFNENIAAGSGLISIHNLTDGGQIDIAVTDGSQVSIAGDTLTLDPTADLLEGKDYAIQIAATAIDDLVGNSYGGIANNTTWFFATVPPDLSAPTVVTYSPANDTSNIDNEAALILTFDEDIAAGSGNISLIKLAGGQVDIAVTDGSQVAVAGSTLTITPSGGLSYATQYAVQIEGTAIDDLAGNSYTGIANNTTWSFTTEDAPPDGVVFFDDFENGANASTPPAITGGYSGTNDVSSYTLANTSKQANTALWVRANQGFGGDRNGLIDETENSGANFTDPAGQQAYALRYTNSGVTTAAGVIGSLTAGNTYTLTFDVCIDGFNAGSAYNVSLVTFNGAARNDARANTGETSTLANTSGNASGASYQQVTLEYTADGSEGAIGHDVAVRFYGKTDAANIDNVSVSVAGGDSPQVDHFTISAIGSPQTVDTPITGITITAKDASDQTVTDFTGSVSFGGSGGFSGTSASFSAGVLTAVSVTPKTAGSDLTLTVDDGAGHTGSVTIATIQSAFDGWSGGTGFDEDINHDGIKGGMAWLLGATSPSQNMASLLPAFSVPENSDFYLFTHRRSAAAAPHVTSAVRYCSDLSNWTHAVHDDTDVIITTTEDFYGSGIDKVETQIRKTLISGNRAFIQLQVESNP